VLEFVVKPKIENCLCYDSYIVCILTQFHYYIQVYKTLYDQPLRTNEVKYLFQYFLFSIPFMVPLL